MVIRHIAAKPARLENPLKFLLYCAKTVLISQITKIMISRNIKEEGSVTVGIHQCGIKKDSVKSMEVQSLSLNLQSLMGKLSAVDVMAKLNLLQRNGKVKDSLE